MGTWKWDHYVIRSGKPLGKDEAASTMGLTRKRALALAQAWALDGWDVEVAQRPTNGGSMVRETSVATAKAGGHLMARNGDRIRV